MKKFILIVLVMIGQCAMQASEKFANKSLDYLKGYNDACADFRSKKNTVTMVEYMEQKIMEEKPLAVGIGLTTCQLVFWYGILNSIWNEKITFSKMDVASVLIPFYSMIYGNKNFQTIGLCMTAVNIARILGNKINAYKAKDEESEEDVQITTVEKS